MSMHIIRSWLSAWEVYPIVLIAAFLRLYQLNASGFDEDQTMVFRMARDALVHGLLPATSNIASIRIVNPPGVIYLLMLPAAFSANPFGAVVFVALLNVLAVLLTYIFTRRYFGRLTAVVAALLYATASEPVFFSRFIWQQNMIAPFVVLFFFALFWGVMERRKGWLFPSLFLLGLLVQLQETTILLAIPLALAILLAPETVRWRDLAFGLLSLVLIFFTYLLWEISTKFFDVTVILNFSKLPSHIDNIAFTCNNRLLLVTRWQFLRSQQPVYRTTYTYAITASFNVGGSTAPGAQSLCVATSISSGDQLIATFPLPVSTLIPRSISISARYIVTHPYDFTVGPVHLENIRDQGSVPVRLQTMGGSERITLPWA